MREQSHKDEMARALRGDFARLRARGVATTLEPAALPPPVHTQPGIVEPEPEPPAAVLTTTSATAPAGASEPSAAPASWLARVIGRR